MKSFKFIHFWQTLMRKLIGVIFFGVLLTTANVQGFTYFEGSQFKNTTAASFTLNMIEGFYAILFDKTGCFADESTLQATVDIKLTFFDNPAVEPLEETFNLEGSTARSYRFSIKTLLDTTDQIGFEISSTSRVSLWVSTDSERAVFENEIRECPQTTTSETKTTTSETETTTSETETTTSETETTTSETVNLNFLLFGIFSVFIVLVGIRIFSKFKSNTGSK